MVLPETACDLVWSLCRYQILAPRIKRVCKDLQNKIIFALNYFYVSLKAFPEDKFYIGYLLLSNAYILFDVFFSDIFMIK